MIYLFLVSIKDEITKNCWMLKHKLWILINNYNKLISRYRYIYISLYILLRIYQFKHCY